MKTKLITAAMLGSLFVGPAYANPDGGGQTFDWCTRYKQRYGYQAPDGPDQPCFQTDRYRGNGDGSRSVGVRRERWGVDGTHPAHPTTRPPNTSK